MDNLFPVTGEFIYVGAPADPMDSILAQNQKMLSFLLINLLL